MELGLFGFSVAAIWGSYGEMVPTYMHLMLMTVMTQVMKESAGPPPMRGAMKALSSRQRQMMGARG
jgi:hypothetical protein